MTPNTTPDLTPAATKLGVGTDRIRAALRVENFPMQTLIQATQLGPHIIDKLTAGGDIADEHLDKIAGFLKGEYSLSGIEEKWVRRAPVRVSETQPLPLACPTLVVGPEHAHPLGEAAPEPTPDTGESGMTALNDAMPTIPPVEAKPIFGKRS